MTPTRPHTRLRLRFYWFGSKLTAHPLPMTPAWNTVLDPIGWTGMDPNLKFSRKSLAVSLSRWLLLAGLSVSLFQRYIFRLFPFNKGAGVYIIPLKKLPKCKKRSFYALYFFFITYEYIFLLEKLLIHAVAVKLNFSKIGKKVDKCVAKPLHFDVDPNPDPRIHFREKWIRLEKIPFVFLLFFFKRYNYNTKK